MLFYSMTACTTQRVACPLPVQVESVRIWSFTVGTAPVRITDREMPSSMKVFLIVSSENAL